METKTYEAITDIYMDGQLVIEKGWVKQVPEHQTEIAIRRTIPDPETYLKQFISFIPFKNKNLFKEVVS